MGINYKKIGLTGKVMLLLWVCNNNLVTMEAKINKNVHWAVSEHNFKSEASFNDSLQSKKEKMLNTFTVTNTNNTGVGSLRQAITDANALPGLDMISFSIGSGLQTIAIGAGGLPFITDEVIIDATTQPGYSGTPIIQLDGSGATGATAALALRTSNSTVKGFIVINFPDDGLEADGSTGFGDNNIIEGNWVGINSAGAAAGNLDGGILIAEDADNNIIRNNVVGSNANDGIEILNTGSNNNWVYGNIIGLAADGTTIRANGQAGIDINGAASYNIIGTNADGSNDTAERNVISANTLYGVALVGSGANNNTIAGNYIGLTTAGNVLRGNGNDGVFIINGASNNTVGGTIAAARNVIAGNSDGVQIGGASGGSNNNIIRGNYIGTDYTGTVDLGNNDDGVDIDNAALDNQVIDNLISGNSGEGIDLGDAGASTGTIIRGNKIGVAADGTTALGNNGYGILVGNGGTANNTIIGGIIAGQGNTIAYNGADGVSVAASTNVSILGNSIFSNTELGIDLGPNGVTNNDGGDGDIGANNLQNYPLLASAVISGTNITIIGSLNGANSTAYTIHFYSSPTADPTRSGEGKVYLNSVVVITNGSGNATINSILATTVTVGHVISATATHATDGTSEFSKAIVATTDHIMVVDTYNDVSDGNTGSLLLLSQNRGADLMISLREAITAANNTANSGGPDEIRFNIPEALVGGVHTITIAAAALPTNTQPVIIDATSEPDFSSTPVIELNGNNIGGLFKGLVLNAGSDGSTIRGFTINRFTGTGIEINGSNNHTIQGNWIGLNAAGNAASANGVKGIYATTSTGNLIGGTTVANRNVISGNAQQGIYFSNTDNSTISGNYIGTNASGSGDVSGTGSNTLHTGIYLADGSSGNVIGGTIATALNVISGNNHYGFEVIGSTSQNNQLIGNYIGTTSNGLAALGNTDGGASFWGAGTGNTFGTGTTGARNVISGNLGIGVLVGSASSGATIQGNYIGVGANGTTSLGNGSSGIRVEGGSINTLIGTDANGTNDTNERNIISANTYGIYISDSGTTGTLVAGNYIGLATDGNTIIANSSNGVSITANASNSTIGGTNNAARNVISGNAGFGVYLGGASSNNGVLNNYIGTNATGTVAKGNLDGVWIDGASNNTIGQAGAGNVISASTYYGVVVDAAASTGNVIRANLIGLDASGTGDLGNGAQGILISGGATSTSIGGTTTGLANTVAFNDGDGIHVSAGNGVSILGNSIHSNTDLGIDLDVNGFTVNDVGDGDNGANGIQNFPVLTAANSIASATTIVGSLNSTSSTTFRIEFFSSPTGDGSTYGEGQTFLGDTTVITNGSGNASFTAMLNGVSVTLGHKVSATATVDLGGGNFGNTSEFALNVTAISSPSPGGVFGNLAVWLKADNGPSTSTEGVAVSSWLDLSGNANTVNQVTGSKQPLFRNNATDNINFNPVVDLDGTNDEMNDATGILGTITYTNSAVFAVSRTDEVKDHTLIDETVLGGSHFLLHNPWMDNNVHWDGANTNRISSPWSYTLGHPYLWTGHNNSSLTNKKTLRVNGQTINSSTAALNTFQGNNNPLNLGSEGGLKFYNGKIGEVMFYLTGLTDAQRLQVESYLAIKYGFTLDQTTAQNYIASDGSTIYWNGTSNSAYKNNIAGIARDDASALYQKQSRSVNSGLQVVIGNGNTIATSNTANGSAFTSDKSAMIWGNNASSVAIWTTTGAPATLKKVDRNWRIQENGTVGSVKIQVADNSGTNGLPVEVTTVYLLLDADGNFAAGATEIAMTLNGTNWEANADLTNGQYFSFATEGCEAKAPVLSKK